ncbi:MAG: hypothetical protein QXP01_00165 [Candidatus Hadarchaeum sp.]
MEVLIKKYQGLEYALQAFIYKEEVRECLLSMPGWEELAGRSYGYIRHRLPTMPEDLELPASQDPSTGEWLRWDMGLKRYKVPPESHLEPVVSLGSNRAVHGLNLLDGDGNPTRPLILIGNRNLGNNPGFVAWHSQKQPRLFHLQGEFFEDEKGLPRVFTMLTAWKDGDLTIEPVTFKPKGNEYAPCLPQSHPRKEEEIVWCTYGQQVLRNGKVVPIEEIIDQFYDVRHVFWLPTHQGNQTSCPIGEEELRALYAYYPTEPKELTRWKETLLRELYAGRPRSRYFHNAVGVSADKVFILQRHGTPEEIGYWLREEGAEDGLILDNGGSVFTWAWWAFRDVRQVGGKAVVRIGNVIFSAPAWRPPTISLIAFVLKGPPRHVEPPGAVSMAVV